jgi:hypothetical protein
MQEQEWEGVVRAMRRALDRSPKVEREVRRLSTESLPRARASVDLLLARLGAAGEDAALIGRAAAEDWERAWDMLNLALAGAGV